MNSNANIERLAGLARVRDEDLVSETRTPEARALLAQIVATSVDGSPAIRPAHVRSPRRRRWLAVPALAAAVAATAFAVLVSSGEDSTASAAAATLRRAASVARTQAPLTPGPGQYVYTKSINAYTNTIVPANGAAAAYTALVPHVREIWLGRDDGRLHETSGTPEFLTAQDRQRWVAAGRPDLPETPSESKLPPTRPLNLPTDPNAVYDRLEQEASATDNPVYVEMFTLIGDSLRETAATPAQRAALYQVAARLPGIELLGAVEDSAGRPGVAVAMSGDHAIRSTLIFDPDTSALLAEEQVALAGNPYGYPAGMRIGYATYLVQKIVNSDTANS